MKIIIFLLIILNLISFISCDCKSQQDLDVFTKWDQKDLNNEVGECTKKCFPLLKPDCLHPCIKERLGFSDSCASCYVFMNSCSAKNCYLCALSPWGKECVCCICKYCDDTFYACAGGHLPYKEDFCVEYDCDYIPPA